MPLAKNSAMKKVIIVLGCIISFYVILILAINNFNIGIIPIGILAVALIIYGLIYEKLNKTRKWINLLICGVCIIFLLFSVSIASFGVKSTVSEHENVIIILGSGIKGEEVTPNLSKRLDKAIEYSKINPNAIFVVSGGQGPQESIPEAVAMKRYLLLNGIAENKILVEDKSTSTYENFKFSFELLANNGLQGCSAAFVTNIFHIYRANRIARSMGLNLTYIGAYTTWYTAPINYTREIIAVISIALEQLF